MAAETAALFARGLEEGEAFEEEYREDAGHQVEDDAADEGQADGAEDGDAAGVGLRLGLCCLGRERFRRG